jgi:hypothetical protein
MAQSANANSNVLVVKDTADTLIVRAWYFSNNATDEVDALKVNVETLQYRTFQVNIAGGVANVNQNKFVPGELLTSNTSTTLAYVVEYLPAANALLVVASTPSGNLATLANGEQLKGSLSNSTIIAGNSSVNAVTIPSRLLDLESMVWSVTAGSVELEWKGNAVYTTAALLAGSGYTGKNALQAEITNDATSVVDGNLYISTHGINAKGSYTVELELRKVQGFAERNTY